MKARTIHSGPRGRMRQRRQKGTIRQRIPDFPADFQLLRRRRFFRKTRAMRLVSLRPLRRRSRCLQRIRWPGSVPLPGRRHRIRSGILPLLRRNRNHLRLPEIPSTATRASRHFFPRKRKRIQTFLFPDPEAMNQPGALCLIPTPRSILKRHPKRFPDWVKC